FPAIAPLFSCTSCTSLPCSSLIPPPPSSTLFPYTTLFRSAPMLATSRRASICSAFRSRTSSIAPPYTSPAAMEDVRDLKALQIEDRKSTRLNSSHGSISYAVFCLKKKKEDKHTTQSKK